MDKALQREKTLERVKRYRDKRKGVTSEGVTSEGVTKDGTYFKDGIEMVPASYVQGITGKFEALPERPRYLTMTDGQTLDRANQPQGMTSEDRILRMQACNEASYNFKPHKNSAGLARTTIKI